MWSLAKSLLGLGVMLVLAYAVFFVDLGDKPLAGHLHDVWQSEAVQAKIDLVRDRVKNELEDRLAAVAEQQTRKMVRETVGTGDSELSEQDRKSLEEIIQQQQ